MSFKFSNIWFCGLDEAFGVVGGRFYDIRPFFFRACPTSGEILSYGTEPVTRHFLPIQFTAEFLVDNCPVFFKFPEYRNIFFV